VRLGILLLLAASALAQVEVLDSGTKESLRGVSIFDQRTIWASGTHDTYLVTTDGGKTWNVGKVPGAQDLDFRGVKAFHSEAFLLASGPGDRSRIYHLRVGKQWELQFTNHDANGFFDCMAFFDRLHGIVVGDPVNGKFQILLTADGGRTWRYSDPQKMPPAIPGEGAFAASNTCIAVNGTKAAWFATGGGAARVFTSDDAGESWSVADTPIVHGSPSQGIFSIAFKDSLDGVIAGGDYKNPDQGGSYLATTGDGGKTWKPATPPQTRFFSGIAYVLGGSDATGLITVGSSATGFSKDGLHSWSFFLPAGFNSVEWKAGAIYAVGADGKIAKINR
jgi:photosystem II stability/assembly factor-like uncharacterized protein